MHYAVSYQQDQVRKYVQIDQKVDQNPRIYSPGRLADLIAGKLGVQLFYDLESFSNTRQKKVSKESMQSKK